MHGGAGAIISVGLLRRIPVGWFEDCVTTTYSTGGDAFISICLWAVRTLPSTLHHQAGSLLVSGHVRVVAEAAITVEHDVR